MDRKIDDRKIQGEKCMATKITKSHKKFSGRPLFVPSGSLWHAELHGRDFLV